MLNKTNEYMYQGKEVDEELGLNWLDFDARMYDPVLGRWHVQDPMLQHASPYQAMGDNPVSRVDPDGKVDGDHIYEKHTFQQNEEMRRLRVARGYALNEMFSIMNGGVDFEAEEDKRFGAPCAGVAGFDPYWYRDENGKLAHISEGELENYMSLLKSGARLWLDDRFTAFVVASIMSYEYKVEVGVSVLKNDINGFEFTKYLVYTDMVYDIVNVPHNEKTTGNYGTYKIMELHHWFTSDDGDYDRSRLSDADIDRAKIQGVYNHQHNNDGTVLVAHPDGTTSDYNDDLPYYQYYQGRIRPRRP